jgi:uncharacterized membrane protein YhaH (DUF805 family)
MDLAKLFLSFDGRIGRLPFWIGTILIGVLELVLQWALGVRVMAEVFDRREHVIVLVVSLIFLYPTVAIGVKRLHDRNLPGIYILLFVIAYVGLLFAQFFGYLDDPARAGILAWIAIAFILVVGVSFLIELGFRRGTSGPNQYGPDPLGDT